MTVIETDNAPVAVGTYSQGHVVDGRIVTAGQIGLDPASGELVDDDFSAEVSRTLRNVLAIVRAGGGDTPSVYRTTVYLTDLAHYDRVNDVYESTFAKPYPARSVVEVRSIPKNARVEIEAEASLTS